MSADDRPHWVVRVMNQVTDPDWWDGVLLGFAVATFGFIAALWITGN
jgi:hypothetical protein